MANVTFEINGECLDLNDLDDCGAYVDSAALGAMVLVLEEKLEGLVCPVHGEEPVICMHGPSARSLEREVQACYSEFLAAVWKKM